MRILTFIPAWNRRTITQICYKGLVRSYQQAPENLDFITLIVVSNDEDEALAKDHGFDVFRCNNKPLGRKFNAGLEYALEQYNFDYVFQLNSDDLLSIDFWNLFEICINKKLHFFGVDRIYFYNSETKDIREFLYAMGCGIRFIRRDLIELAGFVENGSDLVFELWEPELNSGLDSSSDFNIVKRTNYGQLLVRDQAEQRPVVIDIKSRTNIHLFDEFKNANRVTGSHRIEVLKRFPELNELEKLINAKAKL